MNKRFGYMMENNTPFAKCELDLVVAHKNGLNASRKMRSRRFHISLSLYLHQLKHVMNAQQHYLLL